MCAVYIVVVVYVAVGGVCACASICELARVHGVFLVHLCFPLLPFCKCGVGCPHVFPLLSCCWRVPPCSGAYGQRARAGHRAIL